MLLRRQRNRLGVAFKSKPQSFRYNCPYQLGLHDGEELNTPSDADTLEVELQLEDTVVLATDGLFDVLYPLEILELVEGGLRREDSAQQLARTLARLRAARPHRFAARS